MIDAKRLKELGALANSLNYDLGTFAKNNLQSPPLVIGNLTPEQADDLERMLREEGADRERMENERP